MTIDDALEILDEMPTDGYDPHDPAQYDALKLGIEALERINNARSLGHAVPGTLLPGESLT